MNPEAFVFDHYPVHLIGTNDREGRIYGGEASIHGGRAN